MTTLRVFLARVKGLFAGVQRNADLDQEVQTHLDLLTEDNIRSGMSPRDARLAARRAFGGTDLIKEAYRDQRGLPFAENFARDLRYGARLLLRHPGFTAAALLSLAIGIGANTAIFSLVNLGLFKELPVKDPDTLAHVTGYRVSAPNSAASSLPANSLRPNGHSFSYPMFRDLAARQRVFSDMVASGGFTPAQLAIDGVSSDAADVSAGFVSAKYFQVLGVGAALGRLIVDADSQAPGEGEVAVIGYGLWERRFGRDPSVVGRTIAFNGVPFTIVGVARRGFHGERIGVRRDVWIPILMQPRLMARNELERRTSTWFEAFGRLAPGVTVEQAGTELTVLYRQLLREEVEAGAGNLINRPAPEQHHVAVAAGTHGINEGVRRRMQQPLLLLLGVTGVVLLIACCNVANLLIARGATRQREIAVRLAIGCSRARLIRQLLTESLLLALLGAVIGLVLAQWSGQLLTRFIGLEGRELDLDRNVLTFVTFVSLTTAVLFGLLPAFQVTAIRSAPAALTNAFREAGGAPRRRISRGLVVVQVGLSLWLLIGAGLLVRSLQNFGSVDIGVDRHRILMMTLAQVRPIPPARGAEIQTELAHRLGTTRGVTGVAFAAYGLFVRSAQTAPVRVPDSRVDPQGDGDVRQNYVSPGYFATLGLTLMRGRDFTERDSTAVPNVTILNETMSRHYFGDVDPVGKIVYFPSIDDQGRYIPFNRGLDKAQAVEVVGVVRDARFDSLRDPVRRLAYFPIPQGRPIAGTVLIRTAGDAATLTAAARQAASDIEPNLAIRSVTTLEEQIASTLGQERTMATALGVFGGLALLLACVGLYGVMAYGVARRTGEIGLRVALGASRSDVIRLILRETITLVVLGVAIGIPAALGTTHFLRSVLFGLGPTDPATFGLIASVMIVIAALAGAIPARRAAGVDPTTALRCE